MATAGKHVVIVTGASAGIGAATALELGRRGHQVALLARSGTKSAAVAEQITAAGGTSLVVEADVADLPGTRQACASVAESLGPVTVLVNNAGTVGPIAALAAAASEEFAACIATNLTGAWNVVATLLPGMVAAGGGVIVNLSSGAAGKTMEGLSAYCSSKAGLAMVTRMIRHEYAAQGISAYGFRPGLVATAMQGKIRAYGINPVAQLPEAALQPPERVAQALAWLVENGPSQWHATDECEVDIRDPEFIVRAGLPA